MTSPIQAIIRMHDHQLRFRHRRVLNAQPYIHYNLRLLGLRQSIGNQLILGFSPFQLDSSFNQVWDQMIIALYTDLIHLWNGFTDSSLLLIQFNNGKGKSVPSPDLTLYASGALEYLAWWWWLYSKGESGGGGVVGERTHFWYALPLERTHFSRLPKNWRKLVCPIAS